MSLKVDNQVQVNNDYDSSYPSQENLSRFKWSFKPYIIILKFFTGAAVNLPTDYHIKNKLAGFFYYCLLFYAMCLLSINCLINYYFANCYSIRSTSDFIDMANQVFLVFGVHFCFFLNSYLLKSKFKKLWDCILSIEYQFHLTETFYRKIRRIVLFAIALLCLFMFSDYYLYLVLGHPVQQDLHLFVVSFAIAGKSWTTVAILMWFFILVTTASALFDELEERFNMIVKIGSNCKTGAEELKRWRKHHALVCQLVTHINKSFGFVLVIAFSHGFVSFINNFYQFIVLSIPQNGGLSNGVPSLLVFIEETVFLSIFIITSNRLQSHGHHLTETVLKLEDPSQVEAHNLFTVVLVQVTHAHTKITAAGLFDINLTLYPALLGTTLTYVIIRLQSNLITDHPLLHIVGLNNTA